MQDPANVPQSPVAPKRFLLTLLGSGIGLAIGFMLAAFFEIPRLFKIQNIEDAKHYTGLAGAGIGSAASFGRRETVDDAFALVEAAAGVAAAIGIIPLIVLMLQATQIV